MNEDEILKHMEVALRGLMHNMVGNPEYKVRLLSIGRLGYEFSEDLEKELALDPTLENLEVWHRIATRHKFDGKGQPLDEVVRDKREDSTTGANMDLLGIRTQERYLSGQERKHSLEEYTSLKDLRKIVEESKTNPNDITVIAGRYDFSFKLKDAKGNLVRDLDPENENDFKVIENIIMTSVYFENPEEVDREKIISTVHSIKEERKKIEDIIREVAGDDDHPGKEWKDGQPWLKRNRAENLIDSIIGIRELGKAFGGYRGNVVMAVNEVDFTHTAFGKSSRIDYRKIDALADNDETRYEHFLAEAINELLGMNLIDPLELRVPTWMPHNEYAAVVADLITYKGEPLYKLIEEGRGGLDKIKKKVGDFGHLIFKIRKSSDKDAATALKDIVKSIMFKGRRSRRPVRSVVGFPEKGYSYGMPVRHGEFGLQEPIYHEQRFMNKQEKENARRAEFVVKYINDRLVKEGILPEKWEYDEFSLSIPIPEGFDERKIHAHLERIVEERLGKIRTTERRQVCAERRVEDEDGFVQEGVCTSEQVIKLPGGFSVKVEGGVVYFIQGDVGTINGREETEKKPATCKEPKIVTPTLHEVMLYAENIEYSGRLSVYDLLRKRRVGDVIFDESLIDFNAWIIGVKEYEDSIIALLGRKRDKKSYDYFAYRIELKSLKSELIGKLNIPGEVDPNSKQISATVNDFDFHDGKLYLAIRDQTPIAIVVHDTVKGKQLKPYIDHPKAYEGVRVVPTSPFKVVGLSNKEINFWEGAENDRYKKKDPHNLVELDQSILEEMNIARFRDAYFVSFCSNGIGRIAILNGRNERIEREFEAKGSRMELYPNGDDLSVFVVNQKGVLQRVYTNSLVELLGSEPLKHESAEVEDPAKAVTEDILGIKSTEDIVVVVGKKGYLLFDKNPLKYRDCINFENAGKESFVIKQRS